MKDAVIDSRIGVIVIGRNEGDRLVRCLESVIKVADSVVYVDSGSTDRSVENARSLGVAVVELDMSVPFTAARARNAGFQSLRALVSERLYVQFVDGDCEVAEGWLNAASAFLHARKDVAAVCGFLRERYPDKSVYNMLCNIEWSGPEGEIKSCGGNSMMRADVFTSMNGFREDLIAGEEPELCVRLRSAGWVIWRIGEEMALHDAAMTRFSQWWKRATRSGYSYAQGSYLHGAPPELHGVRESRSALFWGAVIPVGLVCMLPLSWSTALILSLIYPMQVIRLARRGRRTVAENWMYSLFLVLGKFPEAIGNARFWFHHFLGRRAGLIEHK